MNLSFEHEGRVFRVTTEHAASSYGLPVLTINGELSDDYRLSTATASNGRRMVRVHTWDGSLIYQAEVNRHLDLADLAKPD